MNSREDTTTLPITEEVITVGKQVVEAGHVRVRTVVDNVAETIRDTVVREAVDVRRVPVGRFVSEAPTVREEGDVLIVPVFEEKLVVERRLFLVEEVHLHRSTKQVPIEIPETRRVMHAVVEDDTQVQQQG